MVALNNSESAKSAAIPTYVANGGFTRIYGTGAAALTSDASKRLTVNVPALSAVVYRSNRAIPRSTTAPYVFLSQPSATEVANSRMQVAANVGGSSFNEVTFYAKVRGGDWRPIGTDDTRPYRVFHDVSGIPDGQAGGVSGRRARQRRAHPGQRTRTGCRAEADAEDHGAR